MSWVYQASGKYQQATEDSYHVFIGSDYAEYTNGKSAIALKKHW